MQAHGTVLGPFVGEGLRTGAFSAEKSFGNYVYMVIHFHLDTLASGFLA